jgi:lipopolysaccharide transport system permease protein
MIACTWRHYELILEMVRHDFTQRYRGSYGGILWSFANPLAMLAVFTLAFGGLFSRGAYESEGGVIYYALNIFPGLLLFQALAEVINKAPTLITGNPAYVKKIVFPLEALPITAVLAALSHLFIGLIVWGVIYGLFFNQVPYGAMYVPLLLVIFAPALLFFGLLFSALGVFVRDLNHIVVPFGQAMLFLSPVFYRTENIPLKWQMLLNFNPLTIIVEQIRVVVAQGQISDWVGLILYFATANFLCSMAWLVFQWCRGRFADLV